MTWCVENLPDSLKLIQAELSKPCYFLEPLDPILSSWCHWDHSLDGAVLLKKDSSGNVYRNGGHFFFLFLGFCLRLYWSCVSTNWFENAWI